MARNSLSKNILRNYRADRSIAEMAALYGISQTTWLRWESGRAYPRGPRMIRLASDMGVTMDELFKGLVVTSEESLGEVANA